MYAKFITPKQGNGQKLIITSVKTHHSGHHRYSKKELAQMIKLKEIPEDLKESAMELFLKGWNMSDIMPQLKTKHSSLK